MGAETANLTYIAPSSLNLTVHTSGDASPLEDYIFFWFKIDPFIDSKRLEVFFYSGGDERNHARFLMRTENKAIPSNTLGIASLLEVKNAQGDLVSRADFLGDKDKNDILGDISEKTWVQQTNSIQFAAIPKKLFRPTESFDWSTVHRISFIFQSLNGGDEICVGDVLLVGGGKNEAGAGAATTSRGGMQGTYRYRVTFLNSTTGNRSNPGSVTQVAKDVNRGYVSLTGIPLSLDAQVDAREIWRTMGDGTRFFKIATIADNTTTTYDDQVADFSGLDSQPGVTVMSTEELELDNDVPFSDHEQHVILKMTAYWISADAAKGGRLYYSPIGRPESQKGYIDVTQGGDKLQRMVVYQGILYVFSESKLFRIQGTDPYIAYEISGVPGVPSQSKHTVVSSPFGIIWNALDGIRICNGSNSRLLNFDPIGRIFRGETAEQIPAFEGVVAEYARGEYLISNGTTVLACEVETGAWRHVGHPLVTSLYYEWDDDVLQGGKATLVELLEQEGTVTDAGTDIDIHWETAAVKMAGNDGIPFIERAIIDIDTAGETITPYVVSRYDTQSYSTISTASREAVEIEIQELLLEPGVRLTGTIGAQVNLYNVELEYRMIELGVTLEGQARFTVPGRWREDLGTNGRIVFEVDPVIKELDQTDKLYIVDRLTVEADTEGTTVTPLIVLENNSVSLTALSTSAARIVNTIDINRVGALNEVQLDGPFFVSTTRPKIYRVEAHLRELKMGLNVTTTGQRGEAEGRSPDPDTAILFEVQPLNQMFNNLGNLYFIERVVLETDTNGTSVTPSIKIGGGTVSLSAFSTTSRSYTERDVERIGPIEHLNLAANFTGDVQLYGVEMFIRPVVLGIRFPDGNRMEVDGKAVASGTEIIFDIDPADRRFDAQSFVPLVERFFLDVDSASNDITVTLTMENQTIILDDMSTSSRDTITYNVNHIGRLRTVSIAADFVTNAIKLYGAEIQMRSLPLGVSIITND